MESVIDRAWQQERSHAYLKEQFAEFIEHPSLARFMADREGLGRLLYVRSPRGTAREWFAASWLFRFPDGFIVDLSAPLPGEEHTIASVETYLTHHRDAAVAIILDGDTDLAQWQTREKTVTAGMGDLLLDYQEAQHYWTEAYDEEAAVDFDQAWEAVGGWLSGLDHVRRTGLGGTALRDVMRWVIQNKQCYGGDLPVHRLAAYLYDFDDELVNAFYAAHVLKSPTRQVLRQCGLLFPVAADDPQALGMPSVIRQVLQDYHQAEGGCSMEQTVSMLRAVYSVHGARAALRRAVELEEWEALAEVLDDIWVDIFTTEPELLQGDKLSPHFQQRLKDHHLAERMLQSLLAETIEQWKPSPVAFEHNRTVRSIRYTLTQHGTGPAPSRVLSLHLILLVYLRLSGYYPEAAEQALRLRDLVVISNDYYRLNPLLISCIYIQCGVCLEMESQTTEAMECFRDGYTLASAEGNDFLCADAAGKLAHVLAWNARHREVGDWVDKAFAHAEKASWGHKTLLRSAYLARGMHQLQNLDLQGMEETLAVVEQEPQALFWETALFLRMAFGLFNNTIEPTTSHAVAALEDSGRRLCSQGRAMLITIPELARFATRQTPPEDAIADVSSMLYLLRVRRLDEVASLMGKFPPHPLGIWGRLQVAVKLCLQASDDYSAENFAQHLRSKDFGKESLLEIFILTWFPGCREIYQHFQLTAEEQERIKSRKEKWLSAYEDAPELTEREHAILDLLRRGYSRAEIAEETFRSENTIKTQIRSLYTKLEASNREEALRRARAYGL